MTSLSDLHRRLGEIDAELGKLAAYKHPSKAQAARAEALADEADEVRAEIAATEARHDAIRKAHAAGGGIPGDSSIAVHRRPGNAELFAPGRGTTDDALRALDMALEDTVAITGRSADAAPAVRQIIERNAPVADYLRATANPDYRSAFGKMLFGGGDPATIFKLTDAERAAFSAVAEAESRTALFTSNTGGYAVPLLLDSSVIYAGAGNANPIRQISRVVTGISDTWTGVSSTGTTAAWTSQGVETTDTTPTLAQPSVPAHKAMAFSQFSFELEGDWQGLMSELSMLFAEAKADLEATAFSTGSGVDEPTGIATALFAGSATSGVLVTTDGQFGAADIYKVFADLGPRYRPNASWVMSIDVANRVRQFGDDKLGNQTVKLSEGYSFPVLGRPAYEFSGLPSFSGTTGAANVLCVGDFRHYVVFDRIGARVELVQHMLGSNRLPNGTRGALFWWRVGADSVNDEAFRMLMNA
jgi:HK97 family phage major capsid protein